MKFTAISDLHGDSKAALALAESSEELVIIAGDITTFDREVYYVIRPFVSRGKKILFVPGNHDFVAARAFEEKYMIKNIQNYPVIYDDVGFFGCGGGTTIGPNLISEKDMFEYLVRGYEKIKKAKKKIMITHMHPKNTLMERHFFQGSSSVRQAIEIFKPDIHICGHIHETEGFEDKIGNTRIICTGKRGIIVEV